MTRTTKRPMVDGDVDHVRRQLVDPAVRLWVWTAAGGNIPAGTRGRINWVELPGSTEPPFWVQILGDVLPFSPAELLTTAPLPANAAATVLTAPPRGRAAHRPAAKPPTRGAATKPPNTSKRTAAGRPVVVTIRHDPHADTWTVDATAGSRRLGRPVTVAPWQVAGAVDLLAVAPIRDAVASVVDAARQAAEAVAAQAAAELDAAQRELALFARPKGR